MKSKGGKIVNGYSLNYTPAITLSATPLVALDISRKAAPPHRTTVMWPEITFILSSARLQGFHERT